MKTRALLVISVLLLACEEKKETPAAPSASATTQAAPVVSSAPPIATASASAAVDPAMDPKAALVTVKDPAAEPAKSVKVAADGTLTLFLPDGWAIESADKSLGKPKEETMPGFAAGVSAHQFQWTMKGVKAGETHKVTFSNKKQAGKIFTLTIEIVAG